MVFTRHARSELSRCRSLLRPHCSHVERVLTAIEGRLVAARRLLGNEATLARPVQVVISWLVVLLWIDLFFVVEGALAKIIRGFSRIWIGGIARCPLSATHLDRSLCAAMQLFRQGGARWFRCYGWLRQGGGQGRSGFGRRLAHGKARGEVIREVRFKASLLQLSLVNLNLDVIRRLEQLVDRVFSLPGLPLTQQSMGEIGTHSTYLGFEEGQVVPGLVLHFIQHGTYLKDLVAKADLVKIAIN